MLLADRKGTELRVAGFDRLVQRLLGGFSACDYMSLKTDEKRYQALSALHNQKVRVNVRKTTKRGYDNYSVSSLEVIE